MTAHPASGRRRAGHVMVPGAADSIVILHVPHAARAIPRAVGQGLLLAGAALEAELDRVTDSLTDRLAAVVTRIQDCEERRDR